MRRFVKFIHRRAICWYLLVAFGFTWSLLPWAASYLPASLIALCGPSVAAFVVTAAASTTERQAFLARLTHWRINFHWYLLALAIPLPVTLFRSAIEFAWVGGRVEVMPLSMLGAVVFVLVVGEEIGWRGFLLPRMLYQFDPKVASVILGVVWAGWHLPLFFMPGMPQYQMSIPAFVFYTVSLSVVLTYLAQHTKGSVIIATLFHGAVNTFGWVNPTADAALRGWTNALCYGVTALLFGMLVLGEHSNSQRGRK